MAPSGELGKGAAHLRLGVVRMGGDDDGVVAHPLPPASTTQRDCLPSGPGESLWVGNRSGVADQTRSSSPHRGSPSAPLTCCIQSS